MRKQRVEDLAVLGGPPAFAQPVHVGTPNLGNRADLHARLDDILDRRWLSNHGPYVRAFERRIAELVGVRHCVATCNGTLALEIAVRALGLTGEVIVPAFTFVATAHALQWQEITPVFCDIDPATCNLDPDKVEAMLTPRTTGIIGVHVWGRPCPVERLSEIAKAHRLRLIFDACHGFGCSHQGRMLGGFGDAEVFSFHATKFLNSFEGGAIVTNNDELARKARLMTNFGFVRYDQVVHVGCNGKMNEVSAAMGVTSLDSMEEFIRANYRNYKQYQAELADLPGVRVLAYDEAERCNYQYVVLEMDSKVTRISRDELVEVLHAENILARRYFYPGCHRMEPYRSYFPHAWLMLPETEKMTQRVLSLPTGTAVGAEQVSSICQAIRLAICNGETVAAAVQDGTLLPLSA